MAVLFKHVCLSSSVGGGGLLWRSGQGNASAFLWGQIRAWLIMVVHPRLELPHSPPLLLGESSVQCTEGSGQAVAQQGWEAGAEGGGGSNWVWKGGDVTSALGGGSPPAVPIWGEKRPRGSSISSRGSTEQRLAAAEQKHTLPLLQHQWHSTLNYFSGKEVYGQWTLSLEHWL